MIQIDQHDAIATRLMDSLYLEAMLLADEARAYFDYEGQLERERLGPIERVTFSCESLKVTTRLMHVISWLLRRRATEAEPERAEASTDAELELADVALSDGEMTAALPEQARMIVDATMDIYRRVQRLDLDLSKKHETESPARLLMDRLEQSL